MRSHPRYVLAVLFVVGAFNFVDRHILAVLLEPIRIELGASDAAMGLLTGFAFVLFYAVASLPLARLADTHSRRTIMTVGLVFWSTLTAASGLAVSWTQLALARAGIGIGEAAYHPASLSMLSDYYPASRRPLVLSVFAVSTQVGIMISLVLGGWLGATVGWRMTMVWLGLPGLLLAALVHLTVREPQRGAAEAGGADVTLYDARTTLAYLWNLRSFRHLALGAAMAIFASSALMNWSAAFLMRVHGMELAAAGAALGLFAGLGGMTGVLGAGAIAQRLARRDPRWLLGIPAIAKLASLPFIVLFLFLPQQRAAVPMFLGIMLFGPAILGPLMTATQGLAKVRMRALAAAVVSFVINVVGVGLGTVAVGVLSDALRGSFGDESLRYALLLSAGASLWAAGHFIVGARTLRAELEGAAV
jgi:predicted MFS family arabinose efflux permease